MKKFVFVYYGKTRAEDIKPEEKDAVMEAWGKWFATFEKQMVDGGNPFASGARAVMAGGVEEISMDKWPAKGYTIVNAKDMNEATEIAKGCPVLEDEEGTVRVYEALPM